MIAHVDQIRDSRDEAFDLMKVGIPNRGVSVCITVQELGSQTVRVRERERERESCEMSGRILRVRKRT